MAVKKNDKKKTCRYEWNEYKCDRPLYDNKHCIFHSWDMEGKKDKFKDAFWKEYESQKKNDELIFTGFVFLPKYDLREANLRSANLRRADLRRADLRRADLRGANLRGANLRGANLEGADLRGADLRRAKIYIADLQAAFLYGTHLEGANLSKVDLREANLRGADLEGANLQGADLREANLEEVDLRRAKLRRAKLRGAKLRGAKLRGAKLEGDDLGKSEFSSLRQATSWGVDRRDRRVPKRATPIEKQVHVKENLLAEIRKFYLTIPVFYGTDRKKTVFRNPKRYYSRKCSELVFGKCSVTIPFKHKMGEIETPSIFKLEFKENPKKHITILKVEEMPENEFLATVKNHMEESSTKEAIVFIHGFNTTFEGAVKRTAQFAYDLGIEIPFLYSWPSYGRIKKYLRDEETVELTVSNLKKFLKLIYDETGITKFHFVAHSMGNRALTEALKEISSMIRKRVDEEGERKIFNEVILAAPDINAELFKRDIAPKIIGVPERITLYASDYDRALKVSKTIHDYPRAGEGGENLIVIPGIDTIDASSIRATFLGHTYFSKNRNVIMDLFMLIKHRLPPESRNLIQRMKGGVPYWIFRK